MARNTIPVFSSDKSDFSFSFSAASGAADGVLLQNDNPPSAQQVGVVAVQNDGTGGAITVTLQCLLHFGDEVGYGPAHDVLDEDGNTITFSADSAETIEANLYEQPWWKENEGFKIRLNRAGSTTLGGNAVCIIK